jgi:hypothetical protein
MSERISKVVRDGKVIVILDLSGLKEEEILPLFPAFQEFVVKERCTRLLIDISDTYTTEKVKAASMASDAYVKEKLGKTSKALVGVKGVQRIIANAIDRNQYFASDREDALRHLYANGGR